jgi:hypothetical protein
MEHVFVWTLHDVVGLVLAGPILAIAIWTAWVSR